MKIIRNFFRTWIMFVSFRFCKVDRKGRSRATSSIASVGVAFGVMALIVVMSVMNGFQLTFIDAIREISSYHVRVSGLNSMERAQLESMVGPEYGREIKAAVPFLDAQGLVVTERGRQSAAIIRSLPQDVVFADEGFASQVQMVYGSFDLKGDDRIILGNTLARDLKAAPGSRVRVALISSSVGGILTEAKEYTVTGVFFCGYGDINQNYAFVALPSEVGELAEKENLVMGLKVADGREGKVIQKLVTKFPDARIQSWREFNRSFFGVLRMEKNVLFLVVFLIFVVVAVNIFNALKRLVFERKNEIAVLSALGADSRQVRLVFIFQGAVTGLAGSLPGTILGILVSRNIRAIFSALGAVTKNPMFRIYASIPAKIYGTEVVLIFLFGLLSALGAAWMASRDVLKMNVAEVLKDE